MNYEDGFPLTFFLTFAFIFGGTLGALFGELRRWRPVGFLLWGIALVVVIFFLPWRPYWTVFFSPVFWLSLFVVWFLKLLGVAMPWER